MNKADQMLAKGTDLKPWSLQVCEGWILQSIASGETVEVLWERIYNWAYPTADNPLKRAWVIGCLNNMQAAWEKIYARKLMDVICYNFVFSWEEPLEIDENGKIKRDANGRISRSQSDGANDSLFA